MSDTPRARIHQAIRDGNRDALQGLNEHWDVYICAYAAEANRLDILQWLRAQTPPCPWDEATCSSAAEQGALDILQWARAQNPPCPWEEEACEEAARHGEWGVLRWLREHGCPWDVWTSAQAACHGHLDIMQWLREQGCPWDTRTSSSAADNGHWHILQWLREQDPPCPWRKERCQSATQHDGNRDHYQARRWLTLHYDFQWPTETVHWLELIETLDRHLTLCHDVITLVQRYV